jgi:hypothetical protein
VEKSVFTLVSCFVESDWLSVMEEDSFWSDILVNFGNQVSVVIGIKEPINLAVTSFNHPNYRTYSNQFGGHMVHKTLAGVKTGVKNG